MCHLPYPVTNAVLRHKIIQRSLQHHLLHDLSQCLILTVCQENGTCLGIHHIHMARIEATVLNSLTPLSKAEICKILPDVSPTTVEAVLGIMVRTGSIKRIGAGRMTKYIRA